jgi:uncharacterized alkaline shock family protein YloU
MAEKARLEGHTKPAQPPRRPPAVRTDEAVDRLHVTDEALATLIGLAAHEVPGVIGMAPANLREGVRRILGKQQADEGVEVTRPAKGAAKGRGGVTVTLHVAVAYGVNIPAVAESVKERVLYAAGAFAGVAVDRVKVHVVGVGRAGR